jgi:hypothetical protein
MDALNYPYIRVRDVEWLKHTLLLFPHVARMTPMTGAPDDAPEIEEYCWTARGTRPLLCPAHIYAERVVRAQHRLLLDIQKRIEAEDGADFRIRFGANFKHRQPGGQRDLWNDRSDPSSGFQIHREKVLYELVEYLFEVGLAWRPANAHGRGYAEMHPRLGGAIMTTLALACAENEGFEIVTEFPSIHGRAIAARSQNVFDDLIDAEDEAPEALNSEGGARRLAEVIVYQRCDVSGLNARDILALQDERAAFARFRLALQKEAQNLPKQLGDPQLLQEHLDDAVNDIFRRWRADRANFGILARSVFGGDVIDEPAKFLEKIFEKATAVSGPAAAGAWMGGLTAHSLVGASGGLLIGVATHTLAAWRRLRKSETDSPWRYLSTLEEGGVGFRMIQ